MNLLTSLLSFVFTEIRNNRVSGFYDHSSAPRYVRKLHVFININIKPYVTSVK